jgi:hypothetical protein
VLFAQLLPEPPDAEIVSMNIDIVQQSNAPNREFRDPALKIVPHRVIGVEPVEMQQVYRTVLDALERLIEGAAQQGRERAAALVVIGAKILVTSLVEKRRVRIALPGVDRKDVVFSRARTTAW